MKYDERPWGHFKVLEELEGATVKLLVVKPGAKLSKQYHEHRKEYLVAYKGLGGVDMGIYPGSDAPVRRYVFESNNPVVVPKGHTHRIWCSSESLEPLHIVEVWVGDILDEDDNIRLEDDYGRIES
jgi:mannose-6-phosphate isomerase-like protein (cupin superfamily)